MEPSLLQTVFLQNDKEMLDSISRRGSWLDELTKTIPDFRDPAAEKLYQARNQKLTNEIAQLKKRLEYAIKKDTKTTIKSIKKSIAVKEAAMKEPQSSNVFDGSVSEWVAQNEDHVHDILDSAYLRTLVRHPTEREIDRSITYLKESPTAKGWDSRYSLGFTQHKRICTESLGLVSLPSYRIKNLTFKWTWRNINDSSSNL